MALPLSLALGTGVWLLAVQGLIWVALDSLGELGALSLALLTLLAYVLSVVWSATHLYRARSDHGARAALPLLVNVVPLLLFTLAPVGRLVADGDFQRHYAARAEVVQRLERGELGWYGSPNISIATLPREYPRSVSNGGGQRQVTVYRDEGALHVAFYPSLGLFTQRPAFLYRADGQAPKLPNGYLPNAIGSEPLGGNWWRVTEKSW